MDMDMDMDDQLKRLLSSQTIVFNSV